MTLNEYLKYLRETKQHCELTFTIESYKKEDGDAFPLSYYYQTPVRSLDEWLHDEDYGKEYHIMSINHPPICIMEVDVEQGGWYKWWQKGRLKNLVVITREELLKNYSETQTNEIIEFRDKEVRKVLGI